MLVIPTLYYANVTWPAGPWMTEQHKTALIRDAVLPYLRLCRLCVTGFLVLFGAGYLPYRWHVDRLIALAVGASVFWAFVFLALFFISVVPAEQQKREKATMFL